ncbi:hypothetical protein [Streptomyces sp. NPDC012888]|uniref:hypothetical protein n=1 Tax=Streptomyces sp. NPDC012888 TaxID=3364855 RepID=UPI0036AFC958
MARRTPLIAVVHSGRLGRVSPQAYAARDGVAEAGVRSVLVDVESIGEPQWALLEAAGGYVLGAPLPECEALRRGTWQGKPAAVFVDGHGPRHLRGSPYGAYDAYERQRELEAFVHRLGMRETAPEVLPLWYSDCHSEAALDSVRRLGTVVAGVLRTATPPLRCSLDRDRS